MDGFAQTREPDDLFDEDFTPLDAPISEPAKEPQIHSPKDFVDQWQGNVSAATHAPSPAPHEAAPIAFKPAASTSPRSLSQPHHSSGRPSLAHQDTVSPAQSGLNDASPTRPAATDTGLDNHGATADPSKPARAQTPVRGDRHLTGGLSKPKLTEEELSAKLAAAKLNSERLAAAHRLAEADEANFHAREAKVASKRVEEGRAKRQMDMDREKNRMRKLGAIGGREWDEGKDETQFQPGADERGWGRRRGGRGANGAVRAGGRERFNDTGAATFGIDLAASQSRYNADATHAGRYHSRGRGGGSGRGRGDARQARPDQAPDQDDFPALPAGPPEKKTEDRAQPEALKFPQSVKKAEAASALTSWADQVAEAQGA